MPRTHARKNDEIVSDPSKYDPEKKTPNSVTDFMFVRGLSRIILSLSDPSALSSDALQLQRISNPRLNSEPDEKETGTKIETRNLKKGNNDATRDFETVHLTISLSKRSGYFRGLCLFLFRRKAKVVGNNDPYSCHRDLEVP